MTKKSTGPGTVEVLSSLPLIRWMTKPKAFVIGLAIGLIIAVAVVAWSYSTGAAAASATAPSAAESLSPNTVFSRVKAQDKLVCASQDYCIVDKVKDSNKIPGTDIEIPFTENSFWYRYSGTLEASVELSTADFSQDGDKLTITLDQPKITSNTPDMERTGTLEENGNFLNPVHLNQVDEWQRVCIERSEQEAKEGGLFDEARQNATDNLQRLFNGAFGDEYQVSVEFRDAAE